MKNDYLKKYWTLLKVMFETYGTFKPKSKELVVTG